jgi:hypothetical protein
MTLTTLRMSSEASITPTDSMVTLVASPTPARARLRASLTLSPAYCSHEKDQHGWQHEVRDRTRTPGSI